MTDKLNSSPDFPWLSDGARVVDWSTMLINRLRQEFGFNALRSNTLLPGDNPVRIVLAAATTFYVATTGSNSNNGLTAATPWLTIQHAIDVLSSTYDFGGQVVTIQVANGTYSEGVVIAIPWVGGSDLFLIGNTASPSSVVISAPSPQSAITIGNGLGGYAPCYLNVSGFTLTAPGGSNLNLFDRSSVVVSGNMTFAVCAGAHMMISRAAGVMMQTPSLTISGGAGAFVQAGANALWVANSVPPTITVTGSPSFGIGLFYIVRNATVVMTLGSFVGAAVGTQYVIQTGAILDGGGRGTSWLPTGMSAGTTDGTGFFR